MFERNIRFLDKDNAMNNPKAEPITGDTLEERLVSALRSVYDPEIPVNIYDLGLIYSMDIRDHQHVDIRMTLTAPACPVAGSMPGAVEHAAKRVPGIETAHVELVWDPPWTQERMSDEARLELGLM
jgi:FeS assembly SUF system protein